MIRQCAVALVILLCIALAGCGGGGGGASTSRSGVLSAAVPETVGRSGQSVQVPVTVDGTATVTTASFDMTFSEGTLGPAAGVVGGESIDISGGSPDCVCRYKWVDEQTVRVMYASTSGAAPGEVLLNVPVKVQSETPADVDLSAVVVNE